MIKYNQILLTVIFLTANSIITAQTSGSLNTVNTTVGAEFDGERAMADLVKQVEAGPRLPNSQGLTFTRQLIKKTLIENGFTCSTQQFTAQSPLLKMEVKGENIYGIYPKGSAVKYVLSAHYDTRPFADQDPDPSRRQDPVPGANDGASGVAVLLELARTIPKSKPGNGIALVFFDIEDHGTPGGPNGFCLGSRYFASNLPPELKEFQCGINLDMVADADLKLPMEGYSLSKSPQLCFDLWNLGNALYPDVWIKERGPSIYDDHMPFLALNRAYIDVIDFQYEPWHTVSDTQDKCSAKSLDIIGDTVLKFILR